MLLETEILDQQCLKQLAKGEVLDIRVKQYLPTDLSRKLADKIMKPGYAHYINAPSIGRIGMAFYEAENQPELLDAFSTL